MSFIRCILLAATLQTIHVSSMTWRANKNPAILGGEYTTIDQFPYAVALFYYDGTYIGYICGGSVVRTDVVLTAAHCLVNNDKNVKEKYVSPDTLVVVAGHEDYRSNLVQASGVKKHKVHEEYLIPKKAAYANDIALLFLVQRFKLGVIQPVKFINKWPKYIKTASVYGWGGTVPDKKVIATTLSCHLKFTPIEIIPNWRCVEIFEEVKPKWHHISHMCAGQYHATVKDNMTFYGDSGSGVVINGGIQIGIVSFDFGVKHKRRGIDIFANVTYFYDWIQDNLKDNED